MENGKVIIVGSGIAGLSLAIKLAEKRDDISIHIYTKSDDIESNTRYAQGGIAGVLNLSEDSFLSHVHDTMEAGGSECNLAIVQKIIYSAPMRIHDLENWGVDFSKNDDGKRDAALEGGHSHPRVIHSKDATGKEIQTVLLNKVKEFSSITLFNHFTVVDLIVENNRIRGVQVLNTISSEIQLQLASCVILSTGGCGQLFKNTTNPSIATGDGVVLAMKKGARVKGMNYIQFHPTAFYQKNKSPLFLISEAVRGAGAHIVNHLGEQFVFETDQRGELATRDIVTKSILRELKKYSVKHVFLDCRHMNFKEFEHSFPTIYAYCRDQGIDIKNEWIPIVPAAHYQCGGIEVDEFGESSILNLFAIGECSNTGMHGKNRLASNSLLEAIAFAHFAAESIAELDLDNISPAEATKSYQEITLEQEDEFAILQNELRQIMYDFAIIGSSSLDLKKGLEKIETLESSINYNLSPNSFSINRWKFFNALELSKYIVLQMVENSEKEVIIADKLFQHVQV